MQQHCPDYLNRTDKQLITENGNKKMDGGIKNKTAVLEPNSEDCVPQQLGEGHGGSQLLQTCHKTGL